MAEKVCIVGVASGRERVKDTMESLAELEMLAKTAGGQVVKKMVQRKIAPEPATLVGLGKVKEIAGYVSRADVKTLIFDRDLTPAQQKNLEDEIPAKILDRSRLILDIFARRARSREGILQVEMAQFMYLLPRLTGRGTFFSQQVGGIGTRGPGERKLEYDRRVIRDRIAALRKEIDSLRLHRSHTRESRRLVPLPQVVLVGYTNAGKSSLLNILTRHSKNGQHSTSVYADDMLFATLDPTTRSVTLPGGGRTLVTDTVGFISKLPHHLVAAFRATLEEIKEADLLVHVIDAANPACYKQAYVVTETLKDIGADKVPSITVYSKADLLDPLRYRELRNKGCLLISAVTGNAIEELLELVEKKLCEQSMHVEMELPHTQRHLIASIYRSGWIASQQAYDNFTKIKIRIDPANWGRIKKAVSGIKYRILPS